MRTGKTLTALASEVERQATTRKDYVAPAKKLEVVTFGDDKTGGVELALEGVPAPNGAAGFHVNNLAHRQIGDHVGVPAKYYDRMLTEAPQLLARNVNHWLQNEDNAARLVRTLDGNVRAFLSDKYRPLENIDLAEAVIPVFHELRLEVVSCELTERRLYIKAVDNRVVQEIEGRRVINGRAVQFDHVSPSVVVSNSEVGMGALSVEAGMFTHDCRNMSIFREKSLRKYHVGGRHDLADGLVSLLTEKTKRLSDAATWAQVTDVVRGALNPDAFTQVVAEIRGLKDQKVTGDVVKVVELASRQFDLQEGERKSVLRHLIEGGDLSRYGLFNAVTRTAEDLEDYDRATDFERLGGKIIELPANDWRRIAEAA